MLRPWKSYLQSSTFTTKMSSLRKVTKNWLKKTTDWKASTRTLIRTKNCRNKRATNSSLKFSFMSKSSDLCQWSTIKLRVLLRNWRRDNLRGTRKSNSTKKTLSWCRSKNLVEKTMKKRITWFVNLNRKIENWSTSWTVSKEIWFKIKTWQIKVHRMEWVLKRWRMRDKVCLWVLNMRNSVVSWVVWWRTGRDLLVRVKRRYQLRRWLTYARWC